MDQLAFDPEYRANITEFAEQLRRAHGARALEVAAETAREHLRSSAWKNCALWLQIVNRLHGSGPAARAS